MAFRNFEVRRQCPNTFEAAIYLVLCIMTNLCVDILACSTCYQHVNLSTRH